MKIKCLDKLIEILDYEIDNVIYTDCLIRKRRLVLLPEEEARQAFISYLQKYTNINSSNYVIKVEYKNLDIAVYNKYDLDDFQPYQSPILIIELKRKSLNVIDFEHQLFGYLELNYCDIGILTNCQQAYIYSKNNNFKRKLLPHYELKRLLLSDNNLEEDTIYFESAKNGDIDSFLFLIDKYGQSCRITFQCSDYNVPIETFLLSHSNNYILFDFCGLKSKRKRPKVNKNNFIKLISIKG